MHFAKLRLGAKVGKYCKDACNPLILFAFWGQRFATPNKTLEESFHMPMTAKKGKKKATKKKAKKAKRKKK